MKESLRTKPRCATFLSDSAASPFSACSSITPEHSSFCVAVMQSEDTYTELTKLRPHDRAHQAQRQGRAGQHCRIARPALPICTRTADSSGCRSGSDSATVMCGSSKHIAVATMKRVLRK